MEGQNSLCNFFAEAAKKLLSLWKGCSRQKNTGDTAEFLQRLQKHFGA